jgi:hypothetical protein
MPTTNLLYAKPNITLLAATGAVADADTYWERFAEQAEKAGIEVNYQEAPQILIVRLPRAGGDMLVVHYSVHSGRLGGAPRLFLQPLMAWQRGVGNDDQVMASPAGISDELQDLSVRLRQIAAAAA